MKKNIMISLGQIPAKLDAVKFIGNKFAGGLMLKLANELNTTDITFTGLYNITIVKWKYNKIDEEELELFKVVNVDDIMEYMEYVKNNNFDAYILGAAVANLMPVNPWVGKFPSHNYKEGDVFDIKFKIAPRIINIVKKYHPKSTLIGFKLSTGCYLDATEVLHESKADLVVYNNSKNLEDVTLCYKTGLHESCNRNELSLHINHLLNCEIGFNLDEYRKNHNNVTGIDDLFDDWGRNLVDIDLNKFFLFKEMEKYIIDDENHGSIFFRDTRENSNKEYYTHTRYGKKLASVFSDEMMLDNMSVATNTEKYTQALPIFLHLQQILPNHSYFIHTHKNIDIQADVDCNYLPPNCSINCAKTIITNSGHLSITKNKVVVKSYGHGLFIAYRNIEDMINDFSDRNWMYYDPPKRYVNDNSDIFKDIMPRVQTCLEVGDNYYTPSKISEGLKRYNVDPYTANNPAHMIHYDLVVAKNCIPIIGLKTFRYYTQLGDAIIFNFPKRYDNDGKTMDRIEECLSGDIKREVSHIVGDKVFHSLMIQNGKTPTKEKDTFHIYDKITEKSIYEAFSKNFEINFRYTSGGIWCLMIKK